VQDVVVLVDDKCGVESHLICDVGECKWVILVLKSLKRGCEGLMPTRCLWKGPNDRDYIVCDPLCV